MNTVVVVVSAMAGETDRLIELSKLFGDNPNKREFDALISTGEKVSASLFSNGTQLSWLESQILLCCSSFT